MKLIAPLALLALAASAHAGGPGPVSPEVRAELEAWPSPKEIRDLATLPTAVAKLCADSQGRFAAPGQKWEPTDYITDGSLPRARLIWFIKADNRLLVHFERGGIAHSFEFLSVKMQNNKPVVLWRADAFAEQHDFTSLLQALRKNDLYVGPSGV